MIKSLKIILFLFSAILIFSFGIYKTPLSEEEKNQILTELSLSKAEKTLNRLTLGRKVGQMLLIGFEGKKITQEIKELITSLHPGGVLLLGRNIENQEQLQNLIQSLQEISIEDTGLPLFIAIDQEGEPMCRIEFAKEKTSQSEIRNIEQAFNVGFNRGKELQELGINLNLAPVLDTTQPDDFLFERSFQRNSQLTGELAKALISGQKKAGILTAIKHFPGYGGISFNPERAELPVLLKIPEISQFKKALEAKPEMIMTANVIYREIDKDFPFTLSFKGINFLKEELKSDFLTISDDLSSPVLKKKFSLERTVVSAVKAGINILIIAGFDDSGDPALAFDAIFLAVENNEISEDKINESILRVIKLKQNLLY